METKNKKQNPTTEKIYILGVTMTTNKTEKVKKMQEFTERKKCIDAAYITILLCLTDMINFYDLNNEKARKFWKWCPNFNEIFLFDEIEKTIQLKNEKYPLIKLYNLIIPEFGDMTMKHKIIIKHKKQKKN